MRRISIRLLVAAIAVVAQVSAVAGQGLSSTAELAARATDTRNSSDERGAALAALDEADSAQAIRIARSLLADKDALIRLRAAWILGDGGFDTGLVDLRRMSQSNSEESNLAIIALGRLHDSGSHELLRSLLKEQIAASIPKPATSRMSALTKALGDYGDKGDAGLVAQAVRLILNS